MKLANKVALVTGAASGIGLVSAKTFLREGAKVVIADINAERGVDAVGQISKDGGDAVYMELDVADEAAWKRSIGQVQDTFGGLHILVNNAGISGGGSIIDCSLEEWNRTISINLTGVFLGCKYGIPLIEKSGGGAVINVSSILGIVSSSGSCAYSASKGGVRSLTKAVALDCAERKNKVRVNSLHPGYFQTQLMTDALDSMPLAEASVFKDAITNQVPLREIPMPDELAEALVFLAADTARFMTGAELVIDGGLTAR